MLPRKSRKKSKLSAINEAAKKILNFITKLSVKQKINISYYQDTKILVNPIRGEESFGLVMAEAMSCGTPVVAFAKGSVPEIIKDGITGYIINYSPKDIRGNFIIKKTGEEGIVEAVKRIYQLSKDDYEKMRKNCRKHVEENFTIKKMVDNYEKVYKKVINDCKKKHK